MIAHRLAIEFIKCYPFDHYSKRTIIGLAAGFDKNCDLLSHIHKLGFAFAEVGSITPKENKGNKNAKVIKFDHSIINNLGLPNIGIDKAIPKLQSAKPKIPILINISPLHNSTFQEMQDAVIKIENYCSAIVLNLFCPNIYCDIDKMGLIKIKSSRPVFIKLSPDLSYKELYEIVTNAIDNNIKGYILTNSFPVTNGGLSGRRLKDFSNASIRVVDKIKDERQIIIGCGGIESVGDILEKIDLGADYIELLTSWILSRNPWHIHNLNKNLNRITDNHQCIENIL